MTVTNCESLYNYIEFVERVRESQRKGKAVSQAINEAVDYAIQHNFLEGFFEEQKMYITNSLLTEFDQELHDRCTYEDGIAEGEARGAQQNAIANAKSLLKLDKLSPEEIADCCNLPLEQVLALKEELESVQKA